MLEPAAASASPGVHLAPVPGMVLPGCTDACPPTLVGPKYVGPACFVPSMLSK